eukprot:231626_1
MQVTNRTLNHKYHRNVLKTKGKDKVEMAHSSACGLCGVASPLHQLINMDEILVCAKCKMHEDHVDQEVDKITKMYDGEGKRYFVEETNADSGITKDDHHVANHNNPNLESTTEES